MRKAILLLLFFSIGILHAQTLPEIENLGLWCVYIETVNGEEPTCDVLSAPEGCWGESITNNNKVLCRIFISNAGNLLYDSGSFVEKQSGATIRVRGNTSASQFEKKPYKIKLQKKADLLCRYNDKYDDKDWLLIKNWGLRGLVGFKMNELLGMPYIPQFRYVNVVLNGVYKGTYLLCESIKRNTDSRINVSKSGYIFEYDAYWWKEDYYVKSGYDVPMNYTFKYPDSEDLTPEILNSFEDYIKAVELSLKTDEYNRYLDIDTFVLWILGQDLLGNFDDAGSNIFLSKYDETDDTKIMMPCLWDFDGIMGSDQRLPFVFANAHRSFYFQALFKKEDFVNSYVAKYDELAERICSEMLSYIDDFVKSDYGKAYKLSFEKDQSIWEFYTRLDMDKSFDAWVDLSVEWFTKRKLMLDYVVAQLNNTTNVDQVKKKTTNNIYNLCGHRLSKIQKGLNIINNRVVLK